VHIEFIVIIDIVWIGGLILNQKLRLKYICCCCKKYLF